MADVTITVTGPVGSGKSALCKEIEILCRALGVPCKWEGGQQERNLSGGDSHDELAMYAPTVTIRETLATPPAGAGEAVACRVLFCDGGKTDWFDGPPNGYVNAVAAGAAGNRIEFAYAAPTPQPEAHMLRELLALIHGDGGHYVAQHGIEKAVADAPAKLAAPAPCPYVVTSREGTSYCSLNGAMPEAVRDADRLDWLTRHVSGAALMRAGVDYPSWSPENVRAAIDAAMRAIGGERG